MRRVAALYGDGISGVGVMLKCKPIADRPSDDALEQTYREGLEIYKQSLLAHDFDQCCFIRGILVGIGIATGYSRGNVLFEMTKDMDSDSEFEAAIHAKNKSAPAAATDEGADE